LEQRVIDTPGVERDYLEMRRQYDLALQKYGALQSRESQAELAQSLEEDRRGERFSVIEPPTAPVQPIWPNRPLILAAGFVIALMMAGGTAVGLDFLTGRIYGPRRLTAAVGFSPLAVIPYVKTQGEIRRERQRWIMLALGLALAVIAGLLYIHIWVRPLDLFFYGILNRLGI
jgi:polysaccharide biosynthesis transport protein